MSNYEETSKLGKLGEEITISFLKKKYPESKFINLVTRNDQRFYGDFCWKKSETEKYYCEVKTEKLDKYNNFFLEHWSNRVINRLGWMPSCLADLLFYNFLNDKKLYVMSMKELQVWAYQEKNIFCYPLKLQTQHEQENVAYGYCVPIEVIRKLGKEVGFQEFSLI
jgi:hypothetical protein